MRLPGFGARAPAPPPPPAPTATPAPAPMPDPGAENLKTDQKRKAASAQRTGRLDTFLSDSGTDTLGG